VALAARIETPMRVLPWMRRSRTAQIVEELQRATPDAFYAIGEEARALGADLSRAINRPMIIDVWSRAQAETASRGRTAIVAGYITPCQGIAAVLKQRVDAAMVSVVPMGVAAPTQPRQILNKPEESCALAVIGQANDASAYDSLLRGISAVAQMRPLAQVFLELRGPREHEIWRIAERLDLLGNVSTIAHAAQYRTLVTDCDLLLIPESSGELRSIMLEAMALGMPVIAREDRALDILADGQTALLVRKSHADEWKSLVLRLLDDPAAARQLGLRGRQAVLADHRSSEQVNRLIRALESLLGSGYRFVPPPT